ncbi:MAG: hypothetical protein M3014_00105 [Chloroflexota bacterium]|nr:hypothetical protein [Chloroflexota bacterium]
MQRARLTVLKRLIAVGGILLTIAPTQAFAHDNLGGDELAVANWMLVGAGMTVVIGLLWGLWAFQSGQFSNVEESKYSMLDNSEDYDEIMLEFDKQEKDALAAEQRKAPVRRPVEAGLPAANPSSVTGVASVADRTAKI